MAKKHTPGTEEKPDRKPFAFMDSAEFVWDGQQWCLDGTGWLDAFLTRYDDFVKSRLGDYGVPEHWPTVTNAADMLQHCVGWPVFTVDPDPMFLRRWLDTWVDTQASRIWNCVFSHMRTAGAAEFDASFKADELARDWEAMFEPTSPRTMQKVKKRR